MKKPEPKDTVRLDKSLADMPVEKQLFRHLKRVHDSLHVEQYQFFNRFEITMAQFDLMETILFSTSQELSIQQLASNTVKLQPNITRTVGVLERAGLVRCLHNKNDQRSVLVKLTEKGERLIARIQQPLLELHISQFKNYKADELGMLNELLKRMADGQVRSDR